MLTSHREHQIRSGQIAFAELAAAVRGGIKPVGGQCRHHLRRRLAAFVERVARADRCGHAGRADRCGHPGRGQAVTEQRLRHSGTALVGGAEHQDLGHLGHEMNGLPRRGLVPLIRAYSVLNRKVDYTK